MSLLDVDARLLGAYFDRRPFFISHRLVDHPLFAADRLARLTAAMPAPAVEWFAGTGGIDRPPVEMLAARPSIEQLLAGRAEERACLFLRGVERDPDYRALLDEALDELQPLLDRLAPGMTRRVGFVILSSPGALTPFHFDPEHNFLLQIRGDKTVHQWCPEDRVVLGEEQLEVYFSTDAHRNLPYRPGFEATAFNLPLRPGQGLHFPARAPHWVQNGDAVSISLSVSFHTRSSEGAATLHALNARLRRYGLRPRPVGESPRLDAVVQGAYRAASRARQLLRRG